MRNKLIAYVLDFVSFMIENKIYPRRVFLYGSVASGEFDRESDIDVFIDIDEKEEGKIRNSLNLFEKTFGEKWELKGVENPLSLIIGNLEVDKWDDLRKEIQSNGIVLYDTTGENIENMNSYLMFNLDFSTLDRSEKVSLWRKLYGYTQKVGKKTYEKKGLIEMLGGKKIEKSIVIIPSSEIKELKDFLNENKIKYKVKEIWGDKSILS